MFFFLWILEREIEGPEEIIQNAIKRKILLGYIKVCKDSWSVGEDVLKDISLDSRNRIMERQYSSKTCQVNFPRMKWIIFNERCASSGHSQWDTLKKFNF